jgi:hypothetical protein
VSAPRPNLLRRFAAAGLCLLAVIGLVGLIRPMLSGRAPAVVSKDPVSDWEDRLRVLRDDLPPSGEIGYVSEENVPGLTWDATDADEEFAMTQYFLAPRVLVRGKVLAVTIGNINLPEDYSGDLKAVLGVQDTTSYGMGIYLFRRSQP